MSDTPTAPKEPKEKMYTQKELDALLDLQKDELKEKSKDWVREKAEEIAKSQALVLAEEYKELSPMMKKFEEDKKVIQYYIAWWALPADMNEQKMMMLKNFWEALGLSLMECITWMCFINGRPALYGSVYISMLTRNWYKIEFLEKTAEKVKVKLTWPNWEQEWYFDKKMAESAWIWKNVYLKYPTRMLSYKAIRDAQNFLCPDILGWVPLVEEADEIPAVNPANTSSDDIKNSLNNSWFQAINEDQVQDAEVE